MVIGRLWIQWSRFQPWPLTLCCVVVGKTLSLSVPLFTQDYKWVTANLLLGITLLWTSISFWRSTVTNPDQISDALVCLQTKLSREQL